jgi:hypothetical protein
VPLDVLVESLKSGSLWKADSHPVAITIWGDGRLSIDRCWSGDGEEAMMVLPIAAFALMCGSLIIMGFRERKMYYDRHPDGEQKKSAASDPV